jgi:hypothetical protein
VRTALLVLALAFAGLARADRRELYVTGAASPSLVSLRDPVAGTARASRLVGQLELASLYGLTNSLHVGGAVRALFASNQSFTGVAGAAYGYTGSLYQDLLAFGVSARAAYRVDTGHRLAPVLGLELGAEHLRFTNLQLFPDEKGYSLALPPQSDTALSARAGAALEWRINDRLFASAGVGYRRFFGSRAAWQLDFPATFGTVW